MSNTSKSKINNIKTQWDLSSLLTGDDDPRLPEILKEIEAANRAFIDKWNSSKNTSAYLSDPETMKIALDEYESLMAVYADDGTPGYYFSLRQSQDLADPKIKAASKKISEFGKKLINEIQFFTHSISKIPEHEQEKFLNSPVLKPYRHFLESLFNEAKYLLSEEEEKLLTLLGSTAHSNWIRMTKEFISSEERVVLKEDGTEAKMPFNEILKQLQSQKKEVRDVAGKAIDEILEVHVKTAEHELNSVLETAKVLNEKRGFKRPDVPRHLSDDIDTEVVDQLLAAVVERFDISQRFYKLKARLLGQDKLGYHERVVEYGSINKKYTFEDSVALLKEVFETLDPEFRKIFVKFVEQGSLDVYPRKGKSGGAFCTHYLKSMPVYILLNWGDRFSDVTTLAHEVGHGINNELMRVQNALNFATPLSTAEVASTFMEDFVIQRLALEADDEMKLAIKVMQLDDGVASVLRQVACYKFEQELHTVFAEKGFLPHDEIGEIFKKHMQAYLGDSVEFSQASHNWWVYWSHIRRFFYVYSYASGTLISKSLQASVKQDNSFISKVKDFLSAGTSDSPKNIFMNMGINITDKKFWINGIKEYDVLLSETEELARKLGKI